MHVLCRGEWALPRCRGLSRAGGSWGKQRYCSAVELLFWWAGQEFERPECFWLSLGNAKLWLTPVKAYLNRQSSETSCKLLFFDQTPGWHDIFGLCILGVFHRMFNSSQTLGSGLCRVQWLLFPVSFLSFMCFCSRMFCLNLENLLPLSHFLPFRKNCKNVWFL